MLIVFVLAGPMAAGPAAAVGEIDLRVEEGAGLQRQSFHVPVEARLTISMRSWSPHDRSGDGERGFFDRLLHGRDSGVVVRSWILDAARREPVWEFPGREDGFAGSGHERRMEVQTTLPAGDYELYLHAELPGAERERIERLAEMEGAGVHLAFSTPSVELRGERFEWENTLLRLAPLGDDELREQAFRLNAPATVRVYAVVEHAHGQRSSYDGGWIVDLDSGARVVDLSAVHGARAGGASRNRRIDQRVSLPAGEYRITVGTDDSHSYERFRGAPPEDPEFWGVTLIGADAAAVEAFETLDLPEPPVPDLALVPVGNDELRRQAFRLESPTLLRLRVMGEVDRDGWAFVDHGWILDLDSRSLVWAMDDRLCDSAGGFERNLVFDGEVRLPAGNYLALYATDGGHAYGDFSGAAPFRKEDWGLQIWSREADRPLVELPEDFDGAWLDDALVAVVRCGDDALRRASFELDEPTTVMVTLHGEARGEDVYDSGFLRESDSGRLVWEPDWEGAEWAGGAERNRRVVSELRLEAGRYEAVVETDDSHSFEGWSGAAPWDPDLWGLVVHRSPR